MKQSAVAARREEGAATLLWCVMGLLVPRAALLGALSPFGIGLAACSAAANLPTLLCVGVGYLLAAPAVLPLRYVAAVALVAGGRWVLEALPEGGRQRFVPPLLAFAVCAATGIASLIGVGADGYRALLIGAEAAVAAGAALCFDRVMRRFHHPLPALTAGDQGAAIAVATIAVCAAASAQVGGFSPGRVAAALLVLTCARIGRESGGCVAGCVLGGGLTLTAPAATPVALILSFGGLLAGLFARFGRVAEGVAFLLGGVVIALTETDEGALMLLGECAAAVVLLCLLPPAWERWLTQFLARRRDLPAAEGVRRMAALRLQVAGGAIEEVSHCVEAVSRKLSHHGAADMAALYRGCAATVCGTCPMHSVCWGIQRDEVTAALETLTPPLRQRGQVTAADVGHLPFSCRRPEALADHLTRGYGEYLVREEAWNRLNEIQQAVEGQFCGTGQLLNGLARQLQDPNSVDVDLSARVLEVCEEYGLAAKEALCTRDAHGRLAVSLLTADEPLPEGRWHRRLQEVCGCALTAPTVAAWGEWMRITLTEPTRYRVERGIATHVCRGETLCGDTVQVSDLGGGALTVLSDGMGCGGRAAVDSAMAAGIATRLWQADFPPDAILQTVNAALLVKSREESLATLDVAVVDTHTGRLDLYKAGAAATLLKSGGRVSRLEHTGLPVGILPQVQFAHSRDTLSEGDVLVMVSDGALSGGVAAVEEILAAHTGDMPALAQAVADAALAADGGHPDDVTVVAMRLCACEPQ